MARLGGGESTEGLGRRVPHVEEAYRLAALQATRYYRLGRLARLGLAGASLGALASSVLILWVAIHPLYRFWGLLVSGEVGLLGYSLKNYGEPLRVPPLDSIKRLSFMLLLGSTLSAALVLPVLASSLRGRIHRVFLEAAAAGYAVAGLTVALLISFLRVLYFDVIPSIPLGKTVDTPYGTLTLYRSNGWYTDTGLLSLQLWNYLPLIAALLIAASGVLIYYLAKYYEEILDMPPILAHNS
jgi:hypothetical protein